MAGKIETESDQKQTEDEIVFLRKKVAALEKELEAANAEFERGFKELGEIIGDGACILDGQTVTWANLQMGAILGFAPVELEGRNLFDFVYEPAREDLLDAYHRYSTSRIDEGTLETMFLHRSGLVFQVEIEADFFTLSGKEYLLVVIRETEAVDRVKRATLEQINRIRRLGEDLPLMFAVTLRDHLIYINAAGTKMLGAKHPEELLGALPQEYFDENFRDIIVERIKLVAAGKVEKTANIEVLGRTIFGHSFEIEVSDFPLEIGGELAVLTVGRDLTEARRTERMLRHRLGAMNLAASVSSRFISVPFHEVGYEINKALAAVGEFLGVDICGLFFWHKQSDLFEFAFEWVASGIQSRIDEFHNIESNQGQWLFSQLHARQVITVHSLDDIPTDSPDDIEIVKQMGLKSFVAVPVHLTGEFRGFVGIGYIRSAMDRKEADVPLLKTLGGMIFQAVDNRDREAELRMRNRELRLINRIISVSNSARSVEEYFVALSESLADHFLAKYVGIYLIDPDGKKARAMVLRGIEKEKRQYVQTLECDSEPGAQVFRHGKTLYYDMSEQERLIKKFKIEFGNGAIVPLWCGDRITGSINVASGGSDDTLRRFLPLIEAIGREAGNAADRFLTRKQLEVSERTSRALLDTSSSMAVLLDIDGRILAINEPAARSLGGEPKDFLGKSVLKLFAQMTPEVAQKRWENAEKALATGMPVQYEEQLGSRWLDVHMVPTLDEQGKAVRLAVGINDISKYKYAEQELRLAYQSAKEAQVAKTNFLANMSHELRSPLNSVIGLSTLLQVSRNLTETDRSRYFQIIRDSGKSLLRMLDEILSMTRIEAGKMRINRVPFAIRKLMTRLMGRYEGQIAQEVSLTCRIDDALPKTLIGDPVLLEHVLTNLLDNAMKFTSRGGISVHVQSCARNDTGVEVRFEVVDTGIGIPEAERARIFDSFYQVDSSTTRAFGGSGLGLTIARELVELMNGEIGVTAGDYDQGSRFYFTCWLEFESKSK